MLTKRLSAEHDAIAPDGSEVRQLVSCRGGGMAHFLLPPGETSVAIGHRTLEEMWFFLSGRGEMWRRSEVSGADETVEVGPGTAITIPNQTHFQFRSFGAEPLVAVGATLPQWPGIGDMSGRGEAYLVEGPWTATVASGSDLDPPFPPPHPVSAPAVDGQVAQADPNE